MLPAAAALLVIAFGLCYWVFDRGGPVAARLLARHGEGEAGAGEKEERRGAEVRDPAGEEESRRDVGGRPRRGHREGVDVAAVAQRWVIQRVRNCAAGSGAPGCHMKAASVNSRPALKASELWSIAISAMTRPRIQSSATRREAARVCTASEEAALVMTESRVVLGRGRR